MQPDSEVLRPLVVHELGGRLCQEILLLLMHSNFVGGRKLVINSFSTEFLVKDEFCILENFLRNYLGALESEFEEVLGDFVGLTAPD